MNHDRRIPRRWRGVTSGRRRRRRAVRALTAGAAIAAGTQAYAAPVRFDNPPSGHPDHFEWPGGTYASPTWLDIQQPAANQPGTVYGASSIGQFEYNGIVSGLWGNSPSPQIQTGDPYDYFVVPAVGLIPTPGLSWHSVAYIYYYGYNGGLGSQLPEGLPVYLGFRFDAGEGNQYAWMGVVREGIELDAFAWGYETEPGVPIPIWPEPGSLALLAMGMAAVRARQRQTLPSVEL